MAEQPPSRRGIPLIGWIVLGLFAAILLLFFVLCAGAVVQRTRTAQAPPAVQVTPGGERGAGSGLRVAGSG